MEDEEIQLTEIKAFGHSFRVFPGLAEDLITLEKEGAVYSNFWNEELQTFCYYRIRLLPNEIFQIVEAHIAKQKFDDVIDEGANFEKALESIGDEEIAYRVLSYGNFGKSEMKDGTILDIRGCLASFYPEGIEDLMCGGRPERYELLPKLDHKDLESVVMRVFDTFPVITKYLGKRKHNKPSFSITDEYDVQDLLYCLIRPLFEDAKVEEWTSQLASKSKRVDIVLPSAGMLIEVKIVRNERHARSIIDELMIDIESYHVHPNCKKLFFFIWDPHGYILDPNSITHDLSGARVKGTSQFLVQVFIKR